MLTTEQKALITATVPLLKSGGEQVTKHFYAMMMKNDPEVRPLFNQTHQADGEQARALALAVLRYAENIEHLENLGPLVARIVNKHVSLQVLPEHYPIVGRNLLQAIRDVLGPEIATDEIIDAWAAAYGQLADLLIGAEENCYSSIEHSSGGWRGERKLKLVEKIPESSNVTSFYFAPVDAKPIVAYTPGQYLALRLVIDGEEVRRNYSLSKPSDTHTYRISVKHIPGGKVSSYLHHQAQEGDVFDIFPPAGEFTLDNKETPIVLIGAGIGITPLLPMLETAAGKRHVTLLYCVRDEIPFMHEIKKYQQAGRSTVHVHDSFTQGRLSPQTLKGYLPQDASDIYLLGPKGFIKNVRDWLEELGVQEEQIHFELFGPTVDL